MSRQAGEIGSTDPGPAAEHAASSRALLARLRYLTAGEPGADGRTVVRESDGRSEEFYRDRWRHDREVVRSTHGGQLHGLLLLDDLRAGRHRLLGDPGDRLSRDRARTCRTWSPGAAREAPPSPGTPTSPGACAIPTCAAPCWSCGARRAETHADPVDAWVSIATDPAKSVTYKDARGHGGFVRATWEEALELCAAAHVDTIGRWGPDRVASVSPIPAMSPGLARLGIAVRGARPAAPELSFYDWYADLPPASPQSLGRPDRRARVRRLVERRLSHDLGHQRAGHPHPRRPLHGRGTLRGARRWWSSPPTTPST